MNGWCLSFPDKPYLGVNNIFELRFEFLSVFDNIFLWIVLNAANSREKS